MGGGVCASLMPPPPLWETLLTIISNVFLLLRSHCKDFRAIHDDVEQTLITLKEMSEDQNHAGFESLKKSPALMKKLCNFNAESLVSKQLQVDDSVMVEHFYSFTTVPFISTCWRNERHVFTWQSTSIKINDMLESWKNT